MGKVEYATLIGHIGKFGCQIPLVEKILPVSLVGQTFAKPDEEVNDAFAMGKGVPPVLNINEKDEAYVNSRWCFDTPGVVHDESILNLLTTEELLLTLPKKMILPRTFLIKPGMSLFLAGVGRLDYLNGIDFVRATVYASSELPIMIVKTNEADRVYSELLGTDFLCVPVGDEERLASWPGLASSDIFTFTGEGSKISACGQYCNFDEQKKSLRKILSFYRCFVVIGWLGGTEHTAK